MGIIGQVFVRLYFQVPRMNEADDLKRLLYTLRGEALKI